VKMDDACSNHGRVWRSPHIGWCLWALAIGWRRKRHVSGGLWYLETYQQNILLILTYLRYFHDIFHMYTLIWIIQYRKSSFMCHR
jgi:hypothetical protein